MRFYALLIGLGLASEEHSNGGDYLFIFVSMPS